MVSLLVNGIDYPLCMTVSVAEAFESRYGEIAKLTTAYSGKSRVQTFKELIWQLARLIEGGCSYAALTSNSDLEPLSEEELGILIPLSRANEIAGLVVNSVADGFRREVETEPDRKNGNATRNKKR